MQNKGKITETPEEAAYSNGRHPAGFVLFIFSSPRRVGHIIIIYIHGLGFNFYATREKVKWKTWARTMRVKLKIKRYPKRRRHGYQKM